MRLLSGCYARWLRDSAVGTCSGFGANLLAALAAGYEGHGGAVARWRTAESLDPVLSVHREM